MAVGYVDERSRVFCVACWEGEVGAGRHPMQILERDNPDDPGDNFWIVDPCEACGGNVSYKGTQVLS